VLQPLLTHPELGSFIAAIFHYLSLSTTNLDDLYGTVTPDHDPARGAIRNPIRTLLRNDLLSRIARGDLLYQGTVPSTVAVEALDRILESIQSEYLQVVAQYESLKTRLLH